MSMSFEQLVDKYKLSFVTKRNDIQNAWENKDILQLHQLLHKLAGSSGSYGFEKISNLARTGMSLTDDTDKFDAVDIEQCLKELFEQLN